MNYATQHHIGNNQNTRRKTTKKTVPTANRFCPLDGQDKGCKRNKERQIQVCPPQPTANGFLKTNFLPRLKETETVPPCRKTILKTERDFYKSLSQMTNHYGIEPMPTQDFEYPYNIALSLSDMERKLKNKIVHWDALRLVQEGTKTYFISEERYNTRSTLYYIPMNPLFLMLKDKRKKKSAQLLLSVCTYLYHIADIPYYRQEDSYLYWQYEMLTDWVEEDEENEENTQNKNEIRQAEWVGERMEQKLFSLKNLEVFKDRLHQFKSKNDFEKECFELAEKALTLYEIYPEERFFRNAKATEWEHEDHENDNILTVEKYISFYADNKGWLAEILFESINNEFNEYGEIQEPIIKKCFDGKPLLNNNLDFEDRLFTLLDDLIYLLNNYKNQNNE